MTNERAIAYFRGLSNFDFARSIQNQERCTGNEAVILARELLELIEANGALFLRETLRPLVEGFGHLGLKLALPVHVEIELHAEGRGTLGRKERIGGSVVKPAP